MRSRTRGFEGARSVPGEIELAVDLSVHLGSDQRLHTHLDGLDMAVGFGLRVDLQTREVRTERGLLVPDPNIENVAERVRRVRRDDQSRTTRFSRHQCERARGRGLSDTALPTHEDDAPVEKMIHGAATPERWATAPLAMLL